jgi:hypothetical protein
LGTAKGMLQLKPPPIVNGPTRQGILEYEDLRGAEK